MSLLDVIKALIPLILIVGLLYTVLRYVKKFGITVNGKSPKLFNINVVSTQMLMPKRYLSVVKVQDKFLLLGISDQSITLLKEIEAADTPADTTNEDSSKEKFIDILRKNIGLK